MSFGWALAFLAVSFLLPFIWFFVDFRLEDGFTFGLMCATLTFVGLGVWTTHYTYEPVDRSNVVTQRMIENGTSKLFVHHPAGTFETSDAYLYQNFDDTTKVEVLIEVKDDVWRTQREKLLVRPKQ